jgi:hypothetical protein
LRGDSSGLRGDIVVNGVRYPLDELKGKKVWMEGDTLNLQSGDAGIPVSAEWPIGVPGGMGEVKRTSRDSMGNAFATLDTSNYGFWRLPPRRVTVTPTIPPTDDSTFGFEDAAQGSLATAITQTALTSGSSTSAASVIVSRLLTQGSAGAASGAAIVGTSLTTLNSATVAASYATASIDPGDNRLLIAVVENVTGQSTPTTPTITTAGGLTWVQVSTVTRNTNAAGLDTRLTVFRAQAAAPSASAVTVDFNSVMQQYCKVSISEFANTVVDTANNGAGAVGTATTASVTSAAYASVDIGSYSAPNNRAFAAFRLDINSLTQTVSDWKFIGTTVTELAGLETTGEFPNEMSAGYVSGPISGSTFATEIRRQAMISATESMNVEFLAIGFEIITDVDAGQLAFVTESIAPTANALVLAAVHNTKASAATPATITGCGITWVKEDEQAFNSTGDIISVWRGLVASPTAGAVTITFAATQTACRWSIVEFQGVLTTGANGADAVRQSEVATGSDNTPAETLAAFGDAANATYAAVGTNATTGITPGTGFTELHEEINSGCLFTQWRSDNDTSVNCTATQAVAWGIVAIEIVAAIGAGYQTASITPTPNRLVLCAVFNNSAGAGTPTLSGCNLTWTQEETVTTSTYRVTVFRALAANPQAGVLTIDFAGTSQTAVRWAVSEFGGVNTTTPVVQSVSATGSGTALSVTLSAGTTANATYGVWGLAAALAVTPESGWTEVHEVQASSGTIETEWKSSFDTSVTATAASSPGITVGAITTGSVATDGTSLTISHAVAAGGDRLLLVRIAVHSESGAAEVVSGVTFGGVALTLAGRTGTGTGPGSEIWYLVAPAVSTADVVITLAATESGIVAECQNYTGVHQTTPIGTFVGFNNSGSDAPTIDATSAAGELVVDCLASTDAPTVDATTAGAGQTQDSNLTVAGATAETRLSTSHEDGAATVTMSWATTGSPVVRLSAVPLKPSAGGSTTWLGIGIEIGAGTTTVASTGTRFAYLLQGQYAGKFSVANNTITVEYQKDFGDSAQCGKAAKFGTSSYAARWFIPTGPSNPFWRLDLIASSGADTWTQDVANNFALAFATTNQGTNTVLVRAHGRYLLDLSADGTSWNADDFEAGDISTAITSLEDSGVTLFVAKEDNLYDYDSGTCRQLTRYQKGDKDSTYGAGLMAPSGSASAFYPHKALHLYDGDRARMVGIDASPINKSIPNISYEPHRGAHMELLYASDDWLYATYKVTEASTTKTYLIAYQRSGPMWIPHGFDRFDGVAHIFLVDSQKRLWFTDIANEQVGYYILGADGSPDAGRDAIGYGTASTTYSVVYPREDFGFPHTLKQLRAVEVKAWNTGSTVPIQVKAYRDGSTGESVGAAIESGTVNKRFWTLNTNDTCYDAQFEHSITTTSGYDNTVADGSELRVLNFRAHAFLRPDRARRVSFVVDTTRKFSNEATPPDDPKSMRDTLKALENAAPVACIDPDGNTLNLFVTKVADAEPQLVNPANYKIAVEGITWISS